MRKKAVLLLSAILTVVAVPLLSQDRIDKEATEKIRKFTTDPQYLTSLVDYLPYSEIVPAPHEILGYITGAPGHMTYYDDILRYYRALDSASSRVKIFEIGKSHEGNTMIVVAVADENTIIDIDLFLGDIKRLADPRQCSESEMKEIIKIAKPFYLLTGGLHSSETGGPEMLMELAYRLVVSETEMIRRIRTDVVTLIVPVLEMDGWNRQVDWYYRHTKKVKKYEDIPKSSPPFWGNYIFHDNNRDGIVLSQPLSKNLNEVFFMFYPQVVHDLHESVPLLYISTGTGPYYPSLSPIVRNEWQWFAFNEVTQMTSLGVPGVWTWGFFTGWYPGYGAWSGNNHNAISRFYETFGNAGANTYERTISTAPGEGSTSEEWYRPLPPPQKTMWSLRNNTNIMESACLIALDFTARHKDTVLENFWRKGRNAVEKGRSEKPYAWIVPLDQNDLFTARRMLQLFKMHRIETKRLSTKFPAANKSYPPGSIVIRMDQPYRNFAKSLLEIQKWPEKSSTHPYDATAWNLGMMLGIKTERIDDKAILEAPMRTTAGNLFAGRLNGSKSGSHIFLPPQGNGTMAVALALEDEDVRVTDVEIKVKQKTFPAGTFVLRAEAIEKVEKICRDIGVNAFQEKADLPVLRKLKLPRVGLYTAWFSTQGPGWARWTLDEIGIPWIWITRERIRRGDLNKELDVLIVPHHGSWASGLRFLRGIDSRYSPLDYVKTSEFNYLGEPVNSLDITGGLGLDGVAEIEKFVRNGGTLITLGSGSRLVTDFGMLPGVSSKTNSDLSCPGTIVTGWVRQKNNPIVYGYEEYPSIFRTRLPLLNVDRHMREYLVLQFGTKLPRDIVSKMSEKEKKTYKDRQKKVPIWRSGLLKGGDALDGTAAIIDAPMGKGRIVLFGFNPFYRWMNHANFPFVYNAIIHWNMHAFLNKSEVKNEE